MESKVTSTYNQGRDYTAAQREEGAQLAAIVEEHRTDLAAMAVAIDRAGYRRDSVGQIFKDGVLVPFPERQTTGITPFALAKAVVSVGPATVPTEPEPLINDSKPARR